MLRNGRKNKDYMGDDTRGCGKMYPRRIWQELNWRLEDFYHYTNTLSIATFQT
jgi:hypothetical protein